MKKTQNIVKQLVSLLVGLKPYKIVLFGSAATGTFRKGSDIDLLVVLDSERTPKNYDEKINNRVMVRNKILDLSFKMPIDLLVYSKPEYRKLLKLDGPFVREINRTGKVVYEKAG